MDEFLKLILTGERLSKLKRFNLRGMLLGVAETACALPFLFIATPSVHAAASIILGILVVVFGLVNTVHSAFRTKLYKSLIDEQIFSDGMNTDEESKARKALAEKYSALYTGKRATVFAMLGIIPVILYAAAAVISALINLKLTDITAAVPVLFVLSTVATVIIAFIPAVSEMKNRSALYAEADGEITVLKRSAGINEFEIVNQSYKAKDTATRSQELFLCDPADRAELRKIASRAGYSALGFGVITIAAMVVLGLMSEKLSGEEMVVSSSCFITVLFFAWVAVAVFWDIRRRVIYKRNALKLTDGEADELRKYLQNEFMKLQRTGNILFSLFCGISTLTGFILGLIGAINDPEVSLFENVTGMTFAFLMISAIVAAIIWTIIYAFYRKKVKPVEMRLDNMRDNYGKTD